VPFSRPSETANLIEFRIADISGFTGTAVYTVRGGSIYVPLVIEDTSPDLR
jgi:hypothetical protein